MSALRVTLFAGGATGGAERRRAVTESPGAVWGRRETRWEAVESGGARRWNPEDPMMEWASGTSEEVSGLVQALRTRAPRPGQVGPRSLRVARSVRTRRSCRASAQALRRRSAGAVIAST